eukprot:maker-scaffold247_size239117-snap-gene-1.21 protein:Tk09333 transcript:maker-scaffold247_size239117-snap-gene-1.21-mRNA-1 annotation:"hypothetical protein DAPPUDRAFT_231317"
MAAQGNAVSNSGDSQLVNGKLNIPHGLELVIWPLTSVNCDGNAVAFGSHHTLKIEITMEDTEFSPITLSDEQKSLSVASNLKGDFDLELLEKHFSKSLKEDGSIDLDLYLLGFGEIYKFLNLLGTVFGWVAADVNHKLVHLGSHRNGAQGSHYATIESMVEFEVKEKIVNPKARETNSGTRNLLRLHRAMDFISKFLEVLPDLPMDDKCCTSAQNAYKKTLIKFHPWVVQKAAMLAMHMLPTKKDLIRKINSGSNDAVEKATETLKKAVQAMIEAYSRTQKVYQAHNVIDLP